MLRCCHCFLIVVFFSLFFIQMDEDDLVCSCSSGDEQEFNVAGPSQQRRRHRVNCILNYGSLNRQQLALFRSMKRKARQYRPRQPFRQRHFSDDNILGENVPIPDSRDIEIQRRRILNNENANYIQIGRGFGAVRYRLKKRRLTRALGGGVEVREQRINLLSPSDHVSPSTPLGDILTSLGVVLDQIVHDAIIDADRNDRLQVIIYTVSDDGTWRRPVSNKPFPVHMYEQERVLALVEDFIVPYDEVSVGDDIHVETVLIRQRVPRDVDYSESEPETGVKRSLKVRLKKPLSLNEATERTSMVKINNSNNDAMCATRAIVVCLQKNALRRAKREFGITSSEYKNEERLFESIRRSDGRHTFQFDEASALARRVNLARNRLSTPTDLEKLARVLKVNIRVLDSENIQRIEQYGTFVDNDNVVVLYREKIFLDSNYTNPNFDQNVTHHFHAVVKVSAFLGFSFYCFKCEVGVVGGEKNFGHRCPDLAYFCYACWDRNCVITTPKNINEAELRCPKCFIRCPSTQCFSVHKKYKNCDYFYCWSCKQKIKREPKGRSFETVYEVKLRHKCAKTCRVCRLPIFPDHKCFMVRQHFKESNDKYLFIDFETDQSDESGKHRVIYCFMKWLIVDAHNKWDGTTVGEKEFGVHYNVLEEVGNFLFAEDRFPGYSIVAHNMRGFDGCFLLDYLIRHGIEPHISSDGLKLLIVKIGGSLRMRLIDSLNFLQISLAEFPRTLGLPETLGSKGYFPHFFTSPETLHYSQIGLPSKEDYGMNDMSVEGKQKFEVWYENRERSKPFFDFQHELREYCKQDVELLMEGCLAFRKTVLKITKEIRVSNAGQQTRLPQQSNQPVFNTLDEHGSCDPFQYATIASMSSAIYKAKFLPQDKIAQIRPSGYDNHLFSSISIEYLEYLRQTTVPNLKHALNSGSGEIKIGRFRVDGFDSSTDTVYEFHGCFWHGCDKCVTNRYLLHPVRGVTMAKLYDDTLQRQILLENEGFIVKVMWECEWSERKRTDPEVRTIVEGLPFSSFLHPRHGFFGGRVDAGLLLYDIDKDDSHAGLNYGDVNSLYPSVNMFDEYPVGHPEIILSNFQSIDNYFGVIFCRVLAPQHLFRGILPRRVKQKLLFPLCAKCADTVQIESCSHSISERAMTGVWVSEELKLALSKGYEILNIFCVHHFKERSKDLFANYIRLFYRIKVGASGNPFKTDQELDEFIDQLKDREGIFMTRNDFKFNAGLRAIAKLILNSLWGRMGMNENRLNTSIVHDLDILNRIVRDPLLDLSSVRRINDNCVSVVHRIASMDCVDYTNNTNIYVAIFTTAHARIRLFNLIDKVGSRFVYCDTDSIIYKRSLIESENLPVSPFLGDLSSELAPGDFIVKLVCAGPKVYGFKTLLGKVVVRIKGFKADARTAAVISEETLTRMVKHYIKVNVDPISQRVYIPTIDLKALRLKMLQDYHQDQLVSSAVATRNAISVLNVNKIRRNVAWEIFKEAEQKMFTVKCTKFIIFVNGVTVPFGYVENVFMD